MVDYYRKPQLVPLVDRQDLIIGQMDKWQAHKENVLHRAFTVVLVWNNQIILQHRKHPAFNNLFDLSFSSHPLYIDGKLQTDLDAIYASLKREWSVEKNDLVSPPKFKGKFYYQAKDPKSEFFEHEIDYIYEIELKKLPRFNPEFAYGIEVIPMKLITDNRLPMTIVLCPWALKIIDEKLI